MKIQAKNIDVAPKIGVEIKIMPIIKDINDNTCGIQYSILSEEGVVIKNGRFELTEEEYAGWGYDNSYIEDIVLNKLSLTRLIEE